MFTLQNYLLSAKSRAARASLIILGNEAADLDSMASAIAYGYLRSLQDPQLRALPVMPIPRADFVLRAEAEYVFNEAGINIVDVVFFDEIDLGLLLKNSAGLILVDHNNLCPQLSQYGESVVGLLDHHRDEGFYPEVTPRIIQTIGSTASLVALEFAKVDLEICQDVATLLCGTILLDTVNLDPEAGRVTQADLDVAMQILPLCKLSRQEFFDNAQLAKFAVVGLSTADVLRKDYKEFQFGSVQCGIASALLPVAAWAELDVDLFASFASYAEARNLDVLLSLNGFTNPDFCRDLIVFWRTESEHDLLIAHLQEHGLELSRLDFPQHPPQGVNGFIRFYSQGNIGISRKKLQPILAEFYKG